MYKVKLDVEMIKELDESEVVEECYIAYLTLLPQIKAEGKMTKEMILCNAELLEDSCDYFYDVVSMTVAKDLSWLPIELLPNRVDIGSTSTAYIYDDFTIDFVIEEDCKYFLSFNEAWDKQGNTIEYDSQLKSQLEQVFQTKNVIKQVKEHFESLRAKAS